jgi:DNA-binding NtrC family response regulator
LDNRNDRPAPSTANLNGLRVLLVEDSWQIASAMKHLLEMHGADVSGPVATTADAARLISERTIDVALVDIHLRGGETANGLIDQLHDRGIRTVVVTGSADVPSVQGKVAAVLTKPVAAEALLQSLRPAGQGKELQ